MTLVTNTCWTHFCQEMGRVDAFLFILLPSRSYPQIRPGENGPHSLVGGGTDLWVTPWLTFTFAFFAMFLTSPQKTTAPDALYPTISQKALSSFIREHYPTKLLEILSSQEGVFLTVQSFGDAPRSAF